MKVLTSAAKDGVVLLEVEGEIDAHTARELDSALNDLLSHGHSRLVVDASNMGYISSAGLRAITFAHREAQQRGGEVRVFGLEVPVLRVFQMAGLDECLHLYDTRQEAMRDW